jgi:hypothetical protein
MQTEAWKYFLHGIEMFLPGHGKDDEFNYAEVPNFTKLQKNFLTTIQLATWPNGEAPFGPFYVS